MSTTVGCALSLARWYLDRGTNRRLESEGPYILNSYIYKRIIIISVYSRFWRVKVL